VLQSVSSDEPSLRSLADQTQDPEQNDALEAQTKLLERYQDLFLQDLDSAIAQVTQNRLTILPRKRSPRQFLTALQLLHCRGLSMTEIAAHVDLGGQSQVSRLLQLPEFRTDIRQCWLAALRDHVPALVEEFDSLDRLKDWDQRLEQMLQEEVETVIQAAVAEASAVRSRPLTSLLARKLCQYLDLLGAQPSHV
jgi:PAS domain-containing protein